MDKTETIEQRIERLATEFTNCTKHQNYKGVLTKELEVLVLMAELKAIKDSNQK